MQSYATNYAPQTPLNILPEPGDDLTYDWQEMVSQFSQRFLKYKKVIATVANDASYTFDYSELANDFTPPILRAYIYEDGIWNEYRGFTNKTVIPNVIRHAYFSGIGFGTSVFTNKSGASYPWMFIAYM